MTVNCRLLREEPLSAMNITEHGAQTLEILVCKIVRVVSLYCPLSSVVHWKDVNKVIASIFPLVKYSKLPKKIEDFVDKSAVCTHFADYNEGRRLSEYAGVMLCRHLNLILTHLMEIMKEACINGKLTNQMVRLVIFSDPLLTDITPFLCDLSI